MGIFVSGKNGDAMGGYAFGRMSKKGRREFAIKKQEEEERELNDNYYQLKRISERFNAVQRKQLRDLKHYGRA